MSYAAHHKDFGSFVPPKNVEAVAKKASILRRIFDAFMESRQRGHRSAGRSLSSLLGQGEL